MKFDGIVIGGGPAGMFAAITAAEQGNRVLLLERNDRLGKKLLITGKGRCNVTNDCSGQEVLQNTPRNGKFLYSAMNAFPPEKAIAFFEANGYPEKTEFLPYHALGEHKYAALGRTAERFSVPPEEKMDQLKQILE